MNETQKIIGLNFPAVPPSGRVWVVSGSLSQPLRVTHLVIHPQIAQYFDVVGARVADLDLSSPFATLDPVTAFAFAQAGGGAFAMPPARAGQTVALEIHNIDYSAPRVFRAVFLAVPDVGGGSSGLCEKCGGGWSHKKDCPEVLTITGKRS